MVATWIGFVVGLLVFAVIGLGTYLLILILKEKKEREDRVAFFNFMPHYSNGRAYGYESKHEIVAGNRHLITAQPTDIMPKNIKEAKEEEIIIGKDKILSLPKGTLSKEKHVNIYLPPNPEDIPEHLQETEFGKALMVMTELKNYKTTIEQILREGGDMKDKLLIQLNSGEISEEWMKTMKSLYLNVAKDALETIKKDKTKTSSDYSQILKS